MKNEYLKQLAEQIDEISEEGDSLLIVANEGEPAFVQIRAGRSIRQFKQNEDMTQLLLVDQTNL